MNQLRIISGIVLIYGSSFLQDNNNSSCLSSTVTLLGYLTTLLGSIFSVSTVTLVHKANAKCIWYTLWILSSWVYIQYNLEHHPMIQYLSWINIIDICGELFTLATSDYYVISSRRWDTTHKGSIYIYDLCYSKKNVLMYTPYVINS